MARKITHTKRGAMYHGVTGRKKAFSMFDLIPKSSSSSKKKTTRTLSHNTSYSPNVSSNNNAVTTLAVILMIAAALVFLIFVVTMCSKPSKNNRHKPRHPKSYYTGHNYMPKMTENYFYYNYRFDKIAH